MTNKNNKNNIITSYYFNKIAKYTVPIGIILYIIIFIITVVKLGKHTEIIEMFTSKFNIIQLIIVCVIIIGTFIVEHLNIIDDDIKNKLKSSLSKSVIALIIAFFAEHNFMFAPFYFVYLFAFMFGDNFEG